MYSTSCEFNNSKNSFKAVCSFAKLVSLPLDELEQNIEPLLRRQGCVEPIVGVIGLVKTAERPSGSIHHEQL